MHSTTFKIIVIALTVTALLSFSTAATALHSLFESMDQNENRMIDIREFTWDMKKYVFNRLDDNDNNIISRSEWDYIENIKDQKLHKDLYKGMDIDNDNLISYKEFSDYAEKHSNIKETFLSLDKNRDGVLLPDDLPDSARPPFQMVTIQF
jgi:Ca2+-binding EF-hand superfamily protein